MPSELDRMRPALGSGWDIGSPLASSYFVQDSLSLSCLPSFLVVSQSPLLRDINFAVCNVRV